MKGVNEPLPEDYDDITDELEDELRRVREYGYHPLRGDRAKYLEKMASLESGIKTRRSISAGKHENSIKTAAKEIGRAIKR